VTFRADGGAKEIPVVVEYRDDDGNRYTATTMVEVGGVAATPLEESDGGIPPLGVVVIMLAAVGVFGAIYYSWRRK